MMEDIVVKLTRTIVATVAPSYSYTYEYKYIFESAWELSRYNID